MRIELISDQIPECGADIVAALARQRARMASSAASLSPDEWEHPSRCGHWSIGDVCLHLCDTGLAFGSRPEADERSGDFDPNNTPDEYVERHRADGRTWAIETLAVNGQRLTDITAGWLANGHDHLHGSVWGAEVDWRMVAAHLVWDGYLHERDIAEPLGRSVEVSDEDMAVVLAYATMMCTVPALRDDGDLPPIEFAVGGQVGSRVSVSAASGVGTVTAEMDAATSQGPDAAIVIDAMAGRGDLMALYPGRDEMGALMFTGAFLAAAN